jgi:glycosyltransferase involved in cell wall biosynthesis
VVSPVRVNRHRQQILSVGAASTRKGIIAFLAASEILAREYPEMRFIWAGKDTASAPGGRTWQRYAADERPMLSGRLQFRGSLSDEEMATLYAESTCYLCTALYESFGLTLVEAMFAGLPIVAPNTASMAELLSHGQTAWLYEPADLIDLVAQVTSVISSAAERERIVAEALQRANREYTAQTMTSRTLEIYSDVC